MKPRKNDPDPLLTLMAIFLVSTPLAIFTRSLLFDVIMLLSGFILAAALVYNEWF